MITTAIMSNYNQIKKYSRSHYIKQTLSQINKECKCINSINQFNDRIR